MRIIGHRGAMGLEPENTLRSIKRALDLGVDMVEFDVYTLKGGEIILMHDDNVDRTTNGHGLVSGFTFLDLRRLDAGQGETVPTLPEALNLINRQVPVNIELKGSGTAEPVSAVINQYIANAGWQSSDFTVSSFNHKELGRFKKLSPDIDTAVLLDNWQWNLLLRSPRLAVRKAKKLNSVALNPDLKFVNRKLVESAHAQGLSVNVYTLVENNDVLKMAQMGVDGIFCNFPDRAKEVLKR
ncbi:MAG TPA: glycerophosphodiester phosphodiesterase family protein [Candidatus Saccharimonadales bacterium]|nr:glycerophosphodiester phosphodiesterase family protein [Candidatus Saccharimonadales bacterium]